MDYDSDDDDRNIIIKKKTFTFSGGGNNGNGTQDLKGMWNNNFNGQEGAGNSTLKKRGRNDGNIRQDKEKFGNHLKGQDWIDEQKKRKEVNIKGKG